MTSPQTCVGGGRNWGEKLSGQKERKETKMRDGVGGSTVRRCAPSARKKAREKPREKDRGNHSKRRKNGSWAAS